MSRHACQLASPCTADTRNGSRAQLVNVPTWQPRLFGPSRSVTMFAGCSVLSTSAPWRSIHWQVSAVMLSLRIHRLNRRGLSPVFCGSSQLNLSIDPCRAKRGANDILHRLDDHLDSGSLMGLSFLTSSTAFSVGMRACAPIGDKLVFHHRAKVASAPHRRASAPGRCPAFQHAAPMRYLDRIVTEQCQMARGRSRARCHAR